MDPERLSEEEQLIKDDYTKPAKALRLGKEFRKAIDLLLTGLERNPGNPRIICSIGQVYLEQGDLIKAEEFFMEVLKTNPDWTSAMNSLGNLSYIKNNPDAAIEWYKKALEIDENDSQALKGLARVLHRLGNLDEAHSVYMKLHGQDPENVKVIICLCKMATKKRDLFGAKKWAEMALEKEPENHMARFLMALYYFHTDDFEKTMDLARDLLREKNLHERLRKRAEGLVQKCIYK